MINNEIVIDTMIPSTGECPSFARTSITIFYCLYLIMEEDKDLVTEESSIDFEVIVKTEKDIIDELMFDTEQERDIVSDIIKSLENSAAKFIKEHKVVQLPYIGCVRINPIINELKETKKNFSVLRKSLGKEKYREYVADCITDIHKKQENIDYLKAKFVRLKQNNKKTYENYFVKFGRAYADMYIFALYNLVEIPFDLEWEEHYQSLKN